MEAIGLNPIRLDRIGLNPIRVNAIKLGVPGTASGSARPYIDPEVLASLVAVCICDGKSNDDPDRAVIKNLVDSDNPFIISNAAFKLNSGYGKYEVDFTSWAKYAGNFIIDNNKVSWSATSNIGLFVETLHLIVNENFKEDINSFKIYLESDTEVKYRYIDSNGISQDMLLNNGENTLPHSYVSVGANGTHIGFYALTRLGKTYTIKQLPLYEGALVTDGKDDLITSTKTVKEMLGGSNEVTVVSMMANLDSSQIMCNSNFSNTNGYNVRNTLEPNGVISMLGYTDKNGTTNNLNLIMGDKNSIKLVDKVNFNSDYVFHPSSYNACSFKTAWYWTIIANKVLTTDQINQVISYFNLDKHVKPDVYYDVKKQGLSNDTPEADWYLKDFSGNGHDMTLYNFAKKLGSGIGKYEVDFNTWTPQSYVADSAYTSNKLHITNIKGGNAILYTKKGANAMKVKITGIQSFNLVYRYIAENDFWEALEVDRDGIYELPASTTTTKTYYTGFTVPYYTGDCDITIEQIPDYEGALVSDGIDDYGKVENLPIYKDYTVAIDRAWTNDLVKAQCLASKLNGDNFGSFSFELIENGFSSYSFGISNKGVITIDSNKKISYQSKYVYNGSPIISGNNVDGKDLFLFRNRDSYPYYAEAAIWSYILFPYTLSEFLLERQLKRYKLGTLYPGMIEWRPKVNINVPVVTPPTFSMNNGSDIITNGQYIPEGTEITIRIFTTTDSSVGGINEATAKINGVDIELSPSGNKTYYGGKFIVSSKQKIDITIDEYIRYENIVQPYPAIINLKQDGKTITWGDKLKVGSDIVFVGSANLLPELYTVSETRYNGVTLYPNTIIKVEKSMVFDNARTYLKANEPSCILSPNRLRIPNSSYKILGYIPDLTGKGNRGRLNNFAYTEESGANEDGSIRFDGTDDHIIIPTIKHGGKALLMKVNWRYNNNIAMAYDQRINWGGLGISISPDQLPLVAYKPYNKVTYIDGIKNESVLVQDLEGITHNITGIYDNLDLSNERDVCISRTSDVSNSGFADMSMYEFMLFPDVPNEEEIKELNDVMGIENNIEVS